MAQLKDDCFAFGGELMPLADALAILSDRVRPVAEPETVSLCHAAGRILAEDIIADCDVPPHDNSAVDGYAVYFDDLDPDGGTRLKVSGRIAAGHPLGHPAEKGEAFRIFTGAPVPDGADAVVMQENCSVIGDSLSVLKKVGPGENLRRAGDDIQAGAVILSAGRRLRSQDIGLLASIGMDSIGVIRRLKVCLLTTGDELVQPGTKLKAGQIYNSNYYTLYSLLQGLQVEVLDGGIVGDDFEGTRAALLAASEQSDCVITTGGE